MATLESLKQALRQAEATTSCPTQSLSEAQYSAGFGLLKSSERVTYHDFIIPQLSRLFSSMPGRISVLEIGPGPRSILEHLTHDIKRKINRYFAFEPNVAFATRVDERLNNIDGMEFPIPSLESVPVIHRTQFVLQDNGLNDSGHSESDYNEKYDIVLFCHSMYGMKPKRRFIERALGMLTDLPQAMVIVFHRDGVLDFDGLVCHQTASFPAGSVCVADKDENLDSFARYIAGYVIPDVDIDRTVRVKWRRVCRNLGLRDKAYPDNLIFRSPNVMVAFTKHATALPALIERLPRPLVRQSKVVKNREASSHRPASVIRPTEVQHIQHCVQWALQHGVSLTVISGGHSGHCLWPNVLAVDLSAFNKVHVLTEGEIGENPASNPGSFVVVEAGCKTEDIVRKTMAAGLTVPMGARPSVGAGLWLQGGIGHLARLHGLACDSIVGAVVVSVNSNRILYTGNVPIQHRPAGAVRSENEDDLLWAIKGSGTNFGIVVNVTFKAYTAPTYFTRNWSIPLSDKVTAHIQLNRFDELVARKLSRNCSADAFLYWEDGNLYLGAAMFKSFTGTPSTEEETRQLDDGFKKVDGVSLFENEMYVSAMHGGHGGGKTSSFKRCLFLKDIGKEDVACRLLAAIGNRPSPLCYLHLLHGGGAIGEVEADTTAFGCRDWDFACIITGVWPRDQDDTETARSVVQWVYNVASDLLPLSRGAYGADLGPDPRDAALATRAFGPNLRRLTRLKNQLDPRNVLDFACPIPKAPIEQKLIILVTGESCAGKDYCADIWVSMFLDHSHKTFAARAVSISDMTKREYAEATGADLSRLFTDRAYKEEHRPDLTKFFQEQVKQRPQIREEHFRDVVSGATDADVLLITGMREKAPLAALSHLVPDSRLIEVHVQASEQTRGTRRGDESDYNRSSPNTILDYCPSFIFDNEKTGNEAAKGFFERYLLPFLHDDLKRLANMVRTEPHFHNPGIEFRHVLGIAQKKGGLALCTSLLQTHFAGDWAKIDAVVGCEAGGFIYASTLAQLVDLPLVLVREAGKLPPPTIFVVKSPSHISALTPNHSKEKPIEMELDVVPRGASVVVIDDVLATGETLCAVLQLLGKAGVSAEDVSVMVVAEFPVHRGRELLRQHGFGKTKIQSLLVFDGA